MSTAQIVEIFKILRKHFQNEEDASRVVEDMQQVIDNKLKKRKRSLLQSMI